MMENITNNTLRDFSVQGFERVDSSSFHIKTSGGTFLYSFGEISINGSLINSFEDFDIPDLTVKIPDWKNLEQTLRYHNESALFNKAFTNASDKGLNLFMITLLNGKRGEASENALSFAFSNLGVTWTEQEKTELNTILSNNSFSIQI